MLHAQGYTGSVYLEDSLYPWEKGKGTSMSKVCS